VTGSGRRLILASASPRRREILSTLGIDFSVQPSHADEASLRIEDDVEFVREAALLKLREALVEIDQEGTYVLAADTIVSVEGVRMGKPLNDRDAIEMLERLAGREHVVRTAIALGRKGQGPLGSRVVETRVWFREASREELSRYVASGEPRDKAGAYGVQGLASGFVTRIEGSYTNVVGLPAAEVVALLLEHGALERWP
jgi:septum formation protein